MGRKRHHIPLRVLLNNRLVGYLIKEPGGAISFAYDETWLNWETAIPVSLSLPLREDVYRGAPVSAVFENLLPDSEALRKRVAERVAADGTDSYSLLFSIGRDCVGALQFVPEDQAIQTPAGISGQPISDQEIGHLLQRLAKAPLGLGRDEDFRISIAGAQEKTALLFHEGKWWKPHGITPTTHIFKTQIGTLPNGIDLSNSVENEYYCLKLAEAFGLPVNKAEIHIFDSTKALVIERFDRQWTSSGRLLRVPQEDCCQALSVPPTRKYQNDGGPGIVAILELLKGSDIPLDDQITFLKAQVIYWLIGATDGHAKNFSLFLGPRGRFRLAPFYDILTAQPSLDTRQIHRKQMKLAMSIGDSRHYAIEYIKGRHFVQTARRAGLSEITAETVLQEIREQTARAFASVEATLAHSLEEIHESVKRAMLYRLASI